MARLSFLNSSTPGTPVSGRTDIFVDVADKHTKQIDDTGNIIDLTGGGTADTLSQVLTAGNDASGLDILNIGYIRDNSFNILIDFASQQLVSGSISLDWNSGTLFDLAFQPSLNWMNRSLYGTTGLNNPVTWGDNNLTIKTGAILINEDNTTAATLAGGAPTFTDYYGGNTNALGDPVDWMPITVNGVTRKIPLY